MTGPKKAKYGKTKIASSCAQTKNAEMSAKLQLTLVDNYSFTILRSDIIKDMCIFLTCLKLSKKFNLKHEMKYVVMKSNQIFKSKQNQAVDRVCGIFNNISISI